MQPDRPEVRPRFGQLHRADGSTVPIVFHPTDDPKVFVGLLADDESPVEIRPGDELSVDVIGPGQSVALGAMD